MNLLGIDYGEKKVGLALSAGELSRPYQIIQVNSLESGVNQIQTICKTEDIERIVIGFPSLDRESDIAKKIELFARELGKKVDLPIVFQDETLSSKEALSKMIEVGKRMKKRQKDDAFAAAIILQNYIDG